MTRIEAMAQVKALTSGWRVLYGVGNPLYEAHAEVISYPFQFTVRLKPDGDRDGGRGEFHVIDFD